GIIFGLGLEKMLSPKRQIPLPYAVTHRLKTDDGQEIDVRESVVWLEIQNARGDWLTIRRTAKGIVDKRLVSTWRGPYLTQRGDWPQADYYVLDAGAATNEAGFHYQLAKFIGWDLPKVQRFDGSEVTL